MAEGFAAVEIHGIPLPAFIKSRCLPEFVLLTDHIGKRHSLRLQRFTSVGCINIVEYQLQRGAVAYDMVDIKKEVEMLAVLQQSDAEETVIIDVKRHPHPLLFLFNVGDMLHNQGECLAIVNALYRVSLPVQLNTGKQRGMCGNNNLCRRFKFFFIQTAVKRIQKGYVVTGFSRVLNALHINAVL